MTKKNRRKNKMAGTGKTQGFTVKIQVVPNDGKPQTKTATVSPSGASLKEVLASAGIDTKNKNITVNGKPADLDRHITSSDVVEAKAHQVQVTERPAGS